MESGVNSLKARAYTCNHCASLPACSVKGMLGKHAGLNAALANGALAMVRDLDISQGIFPGKPREALNRGGTWPDLC